MKAENDAAYAAFEQATIAACRPMALNAAGIAGSYLLGFKEYEILKQDNYPAELIKAVYAELKDVPVFARFSAKLDDKAYNKVVAEFGTNFFIRCIKDGMSLYTPPNKL